MKKNNKPDTSSSSSSPHLDTTTAPTPPFALALDVNDDIHPSALKRLRCPFADVFFVGAAGGDDVYYPEHACGRVWVWVIVFVSETMRVVMGMGVRMVVMVMLMGLVDIQGFMAMIMAVLVIVMVMLMVMIMPVVMPLPRILKPEPRHRIPGHTPQPANLL